MIFVTVGTQKFPFDRLLEAVDRAIENGVIREDVFAQSGACSYKPKHYPCKAFLDRSEFQEKMAAASLVITHAGTGAIIGAVKQRKKVIALPRYARYKEHVDDHQTQVLKAFGEMRYIEACYQTEDLEEAVIRAQSTSYRIYTSNTQHFIADLDAYLSSLDRISNNNKRNIR
jgi:UDP-N-acetylglucosamine transferase subunit ALG13